MHTTNDSRIHQELFLEQFDTVVQLLALFVHHIMYHCVLQMAKHMKCAALDLTVLPLAHKT